MKFAGKTAIITGADSGIGQATAELFAREGADLVISYRKDQAGIAETKRKVEALGRKAEVVFSDVEDPASVKALFAKAKTVFGHPALLVANAGIAMSGMPVEELDDDMLERVLREPDGRGLLRPGFRARKAAGGKGRLVFIGSVAGHLPTPGSSPYGVSKAGVNSLARSLSVEVAPDRINVNAIAPGLMETPMTAKRVQNPKKLESIPLGARRPTRRDRRTSAVPRLRRCRLPHGLDLRHGRRPNHELGRRLSAALLSSSWR